MREATGSSMLLYIVVFFVGIIILFFAGIMAYSKAYKAKNRIIEVIEEYGTYTRGTGSTAENTVKSSLKSMGYQTGDCSGTTQKGYTSVQNSSGYKYCVYNKNANGGTQYKVITYVHFDFPIIGSAINIPVSGETKILGKSYDYN